MTDTKPDLERLKEAFATTPSVFIEDETKTLAVARQNVPALIAEHEALLSQVEVMKEALAFYAMQWECDPSDKMVPSNELEADTGSRAVKALASIPTGGGEDEATPNKRVEELEAELADCAEQLEQAAAEFAGIKGKEAADSACLMQAAFARALLSKTEGE